MGFHDSIWNTPFLRSITICLGIPESKNKEFYYITTAVEDGGSVMACTLEWAGSGNWIEGMRFRSGVSQNDVSAWVAGLDIYKYILVGMDEIIETLILG